MTNYEQWQLETKGNILAEPIFLPSGEIECGTEDLERFAEWIDMQAEQQLTESQF